MHSNKIVCVDLKKIISSDLTVEQYFFAHMIFEGERWKLDLYVKNVKLDYIPLVNELIKKNYMEFSTYGSNNDNYLINNLQITQEYLDLIHEVNEPTGVEAWIDEWYALWPSGIKSGGYYLKTDKKGVLKKMKEFVLSYPNFDKELIIKATENYLLDQSLGAFMFSKLAPYFIYKDGMSVLAGECENIEENLTGELNREGEYGTDEI